MDDICFTEHPPGYIDVNKRGMPHILLGTFILFDNDKWEFRPRSHLLNETELEVILTKLKELRAKAQKDG